MEKRILKGTKYTVQEDGLVFSINGNQLQPFNIRGIPHIKLSINHRPKSLRQDYIVANAFFPLIDEDGDIIHLDDNINNCHKDNLQWISFESNTAIDSLDNNCLILLVDNETSNLINYYRGNRHCSIKTKIPVDYLNTYLDKPFRPIKNKYLFRLSDIEIIDINTAYMIFSIKAKMFIISYDQTMMMKLVKMLKDV